MPFANNTKLKGSVGFSVKRANALTPNMVEIMRATALQGISVYLDTLYRLVPVWSGRLQRSFFPLGERLKSEGVNRPAGPRSGKPQPTSTARAWFEKSGPPDEYGDVDSSPHDRTKFRLPRKGSKGQFSFSFSSDIDYYAVNDQINVNSSKNLKHDTPWESQQEGIANLQTYILFTLPKRIKGILPKEMKAILEGRGNVIPFEKDLLSGQLTFDPSYEAGF